MTTNRDRMRYADFHTAGLSTSTGVVEAGCKTAIGTRLKRTGMHWTVAGADAIIALRCCKLSGRFEHFWERRADRSRPGHLAPGPLAAQRARPGAPYGPGLTFLTCAPSHRPRSSHVPGSTFD